jgi:hypothetical protein
VVNGFRIDAIAGGRLIEIQSAPLAAIRRKVAALLERHRVLVVKPLAARTLIVKRARRRGPVKSQRYSPARAGLLDVFAELVHFIDVFPHPRLDLEILLVEQEEHRRPAPKRRWRSKGFRVDDRRLLSVNERLCLSTAGDLAALLPAGLPAAFTTSDIARAAGIPRWLAQKAAYCLRKSGALASIGKQRGAVVYEITSPDGRVRPFRAAA